MNATLNARQIAILNQIRQEGRVFVDKLADAFAATPQTIRRDLQILADTGEVMRFHGGASLLAGVEYTGFDVRKNIAAEQKEEIGRAVAGGIPNNTVIMINAGTTTAAVARALKNHAGMKIVTDNVNVANDLRVFPGVDVIVPGGTVRRSDGAILSESAVEFIRQFRADIAVIGAAAIDREGSLLDFDLREVHVARAMMENSKYIILAADSSKFAASAPVCIGHLSKVDMFVTDRCTSDPVRQQCQKLGVELVETSKTNNKMRQGIKIA